MDEDETDSGYNTSINEPLKMENSNGTANGSDATSDSLKGVRRPTSLQMKLEKQREADRKSQRNSREYALIDQQPRKTPALVSRDRLAVPWKNSSHEASSQPLVTIDSESEDEFDIVTLTSTPSQHQLSSPNGRIVSQQVCSKINRDLTQQLLKDGYRLDEVPDDADLDLIPPKPVHDRCVCCQNYDFNGSYACVIQ
ncbi:protein FAM219A-like isoform X2 [Anneissia japonica]|uniref:protein FAM219A-like isoform X1 n=1 Tax=Anneissia japonica TaxID=1529436 RepID=UPI0014256586|nr:protein FAM219A-like isoform X1 [Anneissia japonica]XP_033108793.1 protein FAM219A-like isoform X2 [Anneissia japonica]